MPHDVQTEPHPTLLINEDNPIFTKWARARFMDISIEDRTPFSAWGGPHAESQSGWRGGLSERQEFENHEFYVAPKSEN